MPTSMIAAISSEVATGRRMKRRDGFTPGPAVCRCRRIGPRRSLRRRVCGGRAAVRRGGTPQRRRRSGRLPRPAPWRRRAAGRRHRRRRPAPVCSPSTTATRSPLPGPSFTGRTATVSSGLTRYTKVPGAPRCTAAAGITGLSRIVSSSSWTVTNWFANSISSALSNDARSLIMPVVVSIWLSTVSRVPVASRVVPVRSNAVTASAAPARIRRITAGSSSAGKVKMTEIGCSLRNDDDAVGIAGLDVIAGIDAAQPDPSADRRNDPGDR